MKTSIGKVADGLRRARPNMVMLRVQDTVLYGAEDPNVLEWAAQNGYIVLSHDFKTMGPYAYDRVREGLPMPGLILVHDSLPVKDVINDLILAYEAGQPSDWDQFVKYLPL